MRQREAQMRGRVVRIQLERALERSGRVGCAARAKQRRAAAVEGMHRVLAPVKTMRLGQRAFAIQLADRFVDVILREPHEAEQPVQPQRGEASTLRELSILDGGALTKHRSE